MAPDPIIRPEAKYTKLFINNQWVDAVSGKTFATYDPTNGKEICQVAEADKADVDKVTTRVNFSAVGRQLCPHLRMVASETIKPVLQALP